MRFLDGNQLLYGGQFGFRKSVGTVDAMYEFSKLMAEAIIKIYSLLRDSL